MNTLIVSLTDVEVSSSAEAVPDSVKAVNSPTRPTDQAAQRAAEKTSTRTAHSLEGSDPGGIGIWLWMYATFALLYFN